MVKKISKQVDEIDDVYQDILNSIGNKVGKKCLTYIKEVSGWIPTGIKAIDKSFGRGFPIGVITEIYGDYKTGKTLLATYALKKTIDQGGFSILIDTEHKYNLKLAKLAGLDPEKLVSMKALHIEDVFDKMEKTIQAIRENKKTKNIKFTIVWDSVAATPSKKEYENGLAPEMAERARLISQGLRSLIEKFSDKNICIIFINQVRDKLNVMFGKNYETVGGRAIRFASSLRIHMQGSKKIKSAKNKKKIIGTVVSMEVTKNDVGAIPWQRVSFNLYFNKGVDSYAGYIDWLEFNGLLIKTQAKLTDEEKEIRKKMTKEEKKELKEREKAKGKSKARWYFIDDPEKELFSIKEVNKLIKKFPILEDINMVDDKYEKYFNVVDDEFIDGEEDFVDE